MDANTTLIEQSADSKLGRLANHFALRFQYMLSIEPIVGNVIAIGLALGLLILLGHADFFPKWLVKYHHYLSIGIYFSITIQLLKSASHSILLPLAAIGIAGAGFVAQNVEPEWQLLATATLQEFMITCAKTLSISMKNSLLS